MSRNQEHRANGVAAFGGRPIGGAAEGGASVFFVSAHSILYIMNIYGYSLYILYIFHICFLNMFHIFSFVCFVIYSVNSRSGHDQSQTFGSISHASGPKLTC